MIFETHAHYDDEAFDEDREELLSSLPERGIGAAVNVCASVESLDKTLELVEKYPHLYGAVGIHPDDVENLNEEIFEKMRRMCRHPKIVAVGRSAWIITGIGIRRAMPCSYSGLSGRWSWRERRDCLSSSTAVTPPPIRWRR